MEKLKDKRQKTKGGTNDGSDEGLYAGIKVFTGNGNTGQG